MEEPTPQVSIEAINPEIAAEMLELNIDHNRHVSPSKVRLYAADMSAGNWHLTGDPIRFDDNGKMADGQHRLHAIIKSGATVDLVVFRGMLHDTVHVLDSGKNRRLGDAFTIRGFERGRPLASSVVEAYLYERYMADKVRRSDNNTVSDRSQNKRPFSAGSSDLSRTDAMNMLKRRPSLETAAKAVSAATGYRKNYIVRPPVGTAALMFDIAEHAYGGASVIEFIEAVRAGTGAADVTDVANMLHNQLARHHARNADKIPHVTMKILWYRGYNAWVEEIPIKHLRKTKGASYPSMPGDVEWYLAGVKTP